MNRRVPDIDISGKEGYAKLLGHNFDTVQECLDIFMPAKVERRLEEAQKAAIDAGHEVLIKFGGEDFQIWEGGVKGGAKWVIKNDDLQFMFAPPVTEQGEVRRWAVRVRYLAAGLWEHGIERLKQRVYLVLFTEDFSILDADKEAMHGIWEGSNWQRINRVDYAFDFESEAFTLEMLNKRIGENLVLPSGVKYGTWATSTGQETLTIGTNRAGLVIQIYDKGKEISEASGKIWMFKVWEREGFERPADDKARNVWRMEIRFGKEFMKERGILTFRDFEKIMPELLCEAIFKRRLTVPQAGKPQRRPLHPLFAECYRDTAQAGKYAPIGRQLTLRHEEYKTMLDKQAKGIVRAHSVLEHGQYRDAEAQAHIAKLGSEIKGDFGHKAKEEKARERYRNIREAQ